MHRNLHDTILNDDFYKSFGNNKVILYHGSSTKNLRIKSDSLLFLTNSKEDALDWANRAILGGKTNNSNYIYTIQISYNKPYIMGDSSANPEYKEYNDKDIQTEIFFDDINYKREELLSKGYDVFIIKSIKDITHYIIPYELRKNIKILDIEKIDTINENYKKENKISIGELNERYKDEYLQGLDNKESPIRRFCKLHAHLVEPEPIEYHGDRDIEAVLYYLGSKDGLQAKVKTPVETVIFNYKNLPHLIDDNEPDRILELPKIKRTLTNPNLIINTLEDGINKNNYIKAFGNSNLMKSQLVVVKIAEDGTFYVTAFRLKNRKFMDKLKDGQIIYDLSDTYANKDESLSYFNIINDKRIKIKETKMSIRELNEKLESILEAVTCSPEVKKLYRELIKELHPDRSGNQEIGKFLNRAYEEDNLRVLEFIRDNKEDLNYVVDVLSGKIEPKEEPKQQDGEIELFPMDNKEETITVDDVINNLKEQVRYDNNKYHINRGKNKHSMKRDLSAIELIDFLIRYVDIEDGYDMINYESFPKFVTSALKFTPSFTITYTKGRR